MWKQKKKKKKKNKTKLGFGGFESGVGGAVRVVRSKVDIIWIWDEPYSLIRDLSFVFGFSKSIKKFGLSFVFGF